MPDVLGDYAVGATVTWSWATFDGSGASAAPTGGSFRIYKLDGDNEDVQRSSSAGITDTRGFDSLAGSHLLKIDLGDDTDSGFYAAGYDYVIHIFNITIDGKVISAPVATFSIANRPVQAVAAPVITDIQLEILAAITALNAAKYQAKVWPADNDDDDIDHYLATWYEDSEPLVSGVTNPQITVVQAADGARLIEEADMEEVEDTDGVFRYDEASDRLTAGQAYIIIATATIDGQTRTWIQPISRKR